MEEDGGAPPLMTSGKANRRFSRENEGGGIAVVGHGRGERSVAKGAANYITVE